MDFRVELKRGFGFWFVRLGRLDAEDSASNYHVYVVGVALPVRSSEFQLSGFRASGSRFG